MKGKKNGSKFLSSAIREDMSNCLSALVPSDVISSVLNDLLSISALYLIILFCFPHAYAYLMTTNYASVYKLGQSSFFFKYLYGVR